MKRRAPRPQTSSHAAPHNHPANDSHALVRVDGTGIRKKIKKDYEKALRDLENSRRQLDQFHQTDLPQFTRWLNTHFGALLTELRELDQKMAADEELIIQVENGAMFSGCSDARAYQRVMKLRENPEPPRPRPPGSDEADGEREPFGARSESGTDDEEDPMEEFMNEFFRKFAPGARPQDNHGPRNGQPTESAAPADASNRLKELYRSVVRRLHPDSQREMTAQKTEWWHQAQMAYEAGDVEQLEVILTLCEIGDSGTTANTSASLLQRITAQLKSSLREIQRQLRATRREPAWNFSGRTDHAAIADQVGRELVGELMAMRRRWMETQALLARWKAAADRLKPLRPRKTRPRSPDCPF